MEWGCRTVFILPGRPHYKLHPVQYDFGKLSDTYKVLEISVSTKDDSVSTEDDSTSTNDGKRIKDSRARI